MQLRLLPVWQHGAQHFGAWAKLIGLGKVTSVMFETNIGLLSSGY